MLKAAFSLFLLSMVCGCHTTGQGASAPLALESTYRPALAAGQPAADLERVTTNVPWPRGMVFVNDELVVLARGRHRRAGGCDPSIEDFAGTLFAVNPNIAEPVVVGQGAGEAVQENGRILVQPQSPPFDLWDRESIPMDDDLMNRPFCTLVYDPTSQNYFICGYSGVDLPKRKFRKNATDCIYRYDRRTDQWSIVEKHRSELVPKDDLSKVVPNTYYPHHDPIESAAPHGWLNGPDGAEVVGDWLYAVGKDNHVLVQYDLTELRDNPEASAPHSELVFGSDVLIRRGDDVRVERLTGHSAVAASAGYLYVGFRTSSEVVRFRLDEHGDMVRPPVGEVVAEFEPWNDVTRRSANLVDIAFNRCGELFVSCATRGRIWNVGVPDPEQIFDGNDARGRESTLQQPFVDLQVLTDNPKAATGNIALDDQDRLYVCSGNYDAGTRLAGVIYRVSTNPSGKATIADKGLGEDSLAGAP